IGRLARPCLARGPVCRHGRTRSTRAPQRDRAACIRGAWTRAGEEARRFTIGARGLRGRSRLAAARERHGLRDRVEVHWLHEVVLEAGPTRALVIRLLPVAGQRQEPGLPAAREVAESPRDLV